MKPRMREAISHAKHTTNGKWAPDTRARSIDEAA
jgi:hypothetical protein